MSNYLNFSVKTRDEIKDWILKRLGWPLVKVEITDDQLDIGINDALEIFSKYVTPDDKYLALDLETYIEDTGFVLPDTVAGVFAMEETTGSGQGFNTLFSVANTLMNAGMYPIPGQGGGGSWVDYELAMGNLSMIKRMTSSQFYFNYNERTKILSLIPDPKRTNATGNICVGCKVIRKDDQNFGEFWVKSMALAIVRQIVGEIRSKYDGVQLLGGASISREWASQGKDEQEKLLDEIKSYYPITTFYIG